MALQCEIIIEHEGSVSANTIRECLDLVAGAAERAAISVINGPHLRGVGVPDEFLEIARLHVRSASLDAFWLDAVEPGSSKFKGKIGSVLLSVMIATTGGMASKAGFDVLKDTEFWQRTQPQLVEMVNEFENGFKVYLSELAGDPESPREINVEVEFIADRVRIRVRPSQKQSEYLSEDDD